MAPLTCHVIEESSNRQPHTSIPARGMRVVLRCMSHRDDTSVFTTSTTDEGKVRDWPGWKDPNYNLDQFLPGISEAPESTWQLGFGVGIYFGQQNTPYHWIDINFVMQHSRSYHICLILQPYEYRTFILPISPWPIPAHLPHGSSLINNTHTRPQQIPRKKLSKTQQLALMQHYADEPYPKKETYESLANSMNLEKWRVQRWFVEKRRRMRNSKQMEGLEYAQNNVRESPLLTKAHTNYWRRLKDLNS
jgi:5-hydroxyisourate hydrolase-like protein (transthyretin family)